MGPEDVREEVLPENSTSQPLEACVFNCSEQVTQKCRKCQRRFCILHANRFSPNFCKECFANLSILEGKFTRTFEDFDIKTDKLLVTKESCTKYYMDGPDWPFVTAWIDTLNDDELKAIWNFHFFIMKLIEAENETRKIEYFKKLRESPPVPRLVSQTVTTKKIITKQQDTADDVRKKLKKQGMPDNLIEQMIKAMNI